MRDRYLGQSFSTYEEGKVVPSTSRAALRKRSIVNVETAVPSRTIEWKRVFPLDDRRVRSRFRKSDAFVLSLTCPKVNSIYRPTSTCPFCCLWNRNDTRNRVEKWKYHIDRWPCNELDNDECREINGRVMLFCGLWFCLCVWTFILFFK